MSSPVTKDFSKRAICVELNRLITADLDESRALGAAALVIAGTARRRHLLHQALRRRVFQRDLGAAIVALGGVPTKQASFRAKVSGVARRLHQILTGGHEGDAYAACARATEKTCEAYARALRATLPLDVRFGVERELCEIEWDRVELVRLRFGAPPAAFLAGRAGVEHREAFEDHLRTQRSDERAVDAWNDEGGAASRA